jgi:ankyrin repeat protein
MSETDAPFTHLSFSRGTGGSTQKMDSLIKATRDNNVKLVKEILSSGGIDMNALYNDRISPLHWTCLEGFAECVKMLLEAKADPNVTNKFFETPLREASFQGHVECVKLLITHKANVNLRSKDGESALDIAVLTNSVECTKELVQAGAELDIPSGFSNRNPLEEAIRKQRYECAEYLLDVGAKLPSDDAPSWAKVMITKRRNALSSTWAFLGVMRKRVRIYKDMATLLAKYLWSTRFEQKWE